MGVRDGEVGYIKRGPFLHSSLPLCDQSHVEIGNFTTFLMHIYSNSRC